MVPIFFFQQVKNKVDDRIFKCAVILELSVVTNNTAATKFFFCITATTKFFLCMPAATNTFTLHLQSSY